MATMADIDIPARRWAYVTIGGSTAGFAAALTFDACHGFSALHLGLFVAMYLLTSFGIEGGFHRFFAHRAFRARPGMASFLGITSSMAAQGPILF